MEAPARTTLPEVVTELRFSVCWGGGGGRVENIYIR